MDDDPRYNENSGGQDGPAVTGFSKNDPGTDSNARNAYSSGVGEGTTGFSNTGLGQGSTGFEESQQGSQTSNMSSQPGDNMTGYAQDDRGPSSHTAAFDAPGAGTQSTGFSQPNAGGETGFEASHSSRGKADSSGDGEGGVKGAMHKIKDAFTN